MRTVTARLRAGQRAAGEVGVGSSMDRQGLCQCMRPVCGENPCLCRCDTIPPYTQDFGHNIQGCRCQTMAQRHQQEVHALYRP